MRRGLAGHVFFHGVALARKRGAQVMPEFRSGGSKARARKTECVNLGGRRATIRRIAASGRTMCRSPNRL